MRNSPYFSRVPTFFSIAAIPFPLSRVREGISSGPPVWAPRPPCQTAVGPKSQTQYAWGVLPGCLLSSPQVFAGEYSSREYSPWPNPSRGMVERHHPTPLQSWDTPSTLGHQKWPTPLNFGRIKSGEYLPQCTPHLPRCRPPIPTLNPYFPIRLPYSKYLVSTCLL